jgi:hypothetical protein
MRERTPPPATTPLNSGTRRSKKLKKFARNCGTSVWVNRHGLMFNQRSPWTSNPDRSRGCCLAVLSIRRGSKATYAKTFERGNKEFQFALRKALVTSSYCE